MDEDVEVKEELSTIAGVSGVVIVVCAVLEEEEVGPGLLFG